MSVILFTVYASTSDYGNNDMPDVTISGVASEPMTVNATWIDAGMLRIDVTDIASGSVSSVAIRLGDFVEDANNNPYILIQAADLDGNLSGVIQIGNPFYVPNEENRAEADDATDEEANQSSGQNGSDNGKNNPAENDSYDSNYNGYDNGETEPPQLGLTPDGTGSVVDNVVTQNDIEFFTVFTEEGNIFYLVIDRQSNTDNVHLLNAVTEADLMALAERSGNPIENDNVSAIPPIEDLLPPQPESNQGAEDVEEEPDLEPPISESGNNSNFILIGIFAVIAGGVAYYLKIVRPKKNAAYDDDDYDEDEDSYEDDSDYQDSDGDDGDGYRYGDDAGFGDEYEDGGDER